MTATILIQSRPLGVRRAQLDEEGFPVAVSFFDTIHLSPMDALFRARVTGFDDASDMAFLDLGSDHVGDARTGMLNFRRARSLKQGARRIRDCLHEGQMLKVQVVTEPSALEAKAVPVTPRPRLTGRYVIVEVGQAKLTLSKSLTARRAAALKGHLDKADLPACNIIIRDLAAAVDDATIVREIMALGDAVLSKSSKLGLLYAAEPLYQALATCPGETPIAVVGKAGYAAARQLVTAHFPDLQDYVHQATSEDWEDTGIDDALEEALADRIDLPSGGWVGIYPTPALTAIDINMGTALQTMPPAEAKLVVNMEAAAAIAHHLRFQNIGGLVVVDFISINGKKPIQTLLSHFDTCLAADDVVVDRTGISRHGLMELSRQRKGLSLRDRFRQQRPATDRPESLVDQLLNQAADLAQAAAPGILHITLPSAAHEWLSAQPDLCQQLSKEWGRSVTLASGRPSGVALVPNKR